MPREVVKFQATGTRLDRWLGKSGGRVANNVSAIEYYCGTESVRVKGQGDNTSAWVRQTVRHNQATRQVVVCEDVGIL